MFSALQPTTFDDKFINSTVIFYISIIFNATRNEKVLRHISKL